VRPETTEALRAGRELFNTRAFFEAHEVWEVAWRAEGAGPDKQLLQALILVAAGCHKATKGEPTGTLKLLGAALGKLAPFPAQHEGLDLGALRDAVAALRAQAERWAEGGAAPPVTVSLR
jgi:predicted metal-dependent hydrolase